MVNHLFANNMLKYLYIGCKSPNLMQINKSHVALRVYKIIGLDKKNRA